MDLTWVYPQIQIKISNNFAFKQEDLLSGRSFFMQNMCYQNVRKKEIWRSIPKNVDIYILIIPKSFPHIYGNSLHIIYGVRIC